MAEKFWLHVVMLNSNSHEFTRVAFGLPGVLCAPFRPKCFDSAPWPHSHGWPPRKPRDRGPVARGSMLQVQMDASFSTHVDQLIARLKSAPCLQSVGNLARREVFSHLDVPFTFMQDMDTGHTSPTLYTYYAGYLL